MIEAIVTHMKKHITLTDSDIDLLKSKLEVRDVKKKEHLLQAGEVCRHNYFIVKGCFRLYLITAKGAEQVIQFGIEDWWITEYISLKSGKPSDFSFRLPKDHRL